LQNVSQSEAIIMQNSVNAYMMLIISAKWMEWNWRIYCFHCVCPSVRTSVRLCTLIFRCKYLENGLR